MGVTVILVQVQELVGANCYALFKYWYNERKKKKAASDPLLALSQEELNKVYLGPSFELSTRYANSLSVFFVCYMFSTGMPVMLMIGALNFFVTYWVDKFLFIEFCRTPPSYTADISKLATWLVQLALVIHMLAALWTMATGEYFESPNVGYSEYVNAATDQATAFSTYSKSLQGKITQMHTLPLLLLLLVSVSSSVFFYVFRNFVMEGIRNISRHLCGWKTAAEDNENLTQVYDESSSAKPLTYSQAARFGRFKSLATYNILFNPMYQAAFSLRK